MAPTQYCAESGERVDATATDHNAHVTCNCGQIVDTIPAPQGHEEWRIIDHHRTPQQELAAAGVSS